MAESTSTPARAAWKGVLTLNVPNLGLGAIEYHLRAAKAHGDQKPINVVKVDLKSGKKVISKIFATIPASIPEPAPALDAIPDSSPILETIPEVGSFVAPTTHFFIEEDFLQGKFTEVPEADVQNRQETEDGEIIEPFDRTSRIEVEPDGFVELSRTPEYKFKEIYQLNTDNDKKVREDPNRVNQLARYLLQKQTALVAFFSWGRGFQYYTAVIHPYERKTDGKLWLLMGLAEGILQLSDQWSVQQVQVPILNAPTVPQMKPTGHKPKVSISR